MGISVFLKFRHLFTWLKFTIVTPSFYFRNRLFIEKGFRTNNMYTFTGNTQKSFTWLKGSSSNLSLYWFRHRGLKWFLFFLFILFIIFAYLDFFHFSSIYSTQLTRFLIYCIWRSFDNFFFFIMQFFVFSFSIITWLWNFFNSAHISSYFIARLKTTECKIKAPTHLPTQKSPLLTKRSAFSNNSLSRLFDNSASLTTLSHYLEMKLTRRLYLFSFFYSPELKQPTPYIQKDFISCNVSPNPHITAPFTLTRLIPMDIKNTQISSPKLTNYSHPSALYGMFSPITFDALFSLKADSVRTLRWFYNCTPASTRDINYLRNLHVLFDTTQPSTGNLIQNFNNLNTNLMPYQALEWLNHRSNLISRLGSTQALPQCKKITNFSSYSKNVISVLPNLTKISILEKYQLWETTNLTWNSLRIHNTLTNSFMSPLRTTHQRANEKKTLFRRWF